MLLRKRAVCNEGIIWSSKGSGTASLKEENYKLRPDRIRQVKGWRWKIAQAEETVCAEALAMKELECWQIERKPGCRGVIQGGCGSW